ncbi:MAG: hypothetical protein ACYDAQ_03790, partial [Mycobacteriales bacterium]
QLCAETLAIGVRPAHNWTRGTRTTRRAHRAPGVGSFESAAGRTLAPGRAGQLAVPPGHLSRRSP